MLGAQGEGSLELGTLGGGSACQVDCPGGTDEARLRLERAVGKVKQPQALREAAVGIQLSL